MIFLSLIARTFRNPAVKSASPAKADGADGTEAGSPIRIAIIAAFQYDLLRNNLRNSPGKMVILRFSESPSAPRESPKTSPSARHTQRRRKDAALLSPNHIAPPPERHSAL